MLLSLSYVLHVYTRHVPALWAEEQYGHVDLTRASTV